MTSDVPGADDGPGEGPSEVDRSATDDRPLRPDGGRRTRRDPLGDAQTPVDRTRTRPDRGAGDGRPLEGSRGGLTGPIDESCPVTAAIRGASALGRVAHVGPALDRRFGTERRLRTTIDGASRRVDVRAFREPEGDEGGFESALVDQLRRWASVGDVDGVVPVVDSGEAERPWVATASTGPTLRGRETPSVTRALRQATHLSAALAAVHDRGVVHAGIDPGNVVFTLGRTGPPRPALHNPGLVDVHRRYEDPATVLDPRYAAPEFFESDSGIVDRRTDVYGLGAVCFRLFTGVAPVAGPAESIAERVTADEPLPRPSRVEPRLPDAVDEVVRRATATDKFERYDTAHDLHEALVAVRDGHRD